VSKENYSSVKRDLHWCQKRPTLVSKETYTIRSLLQREDGIYVMGVLIIWHGCSYHMAWVFLSYGMGVLIIWHGCSYQDVARMHTYIRAMPQVDESNCIRSLLTRIRSLLTQY